MFITQFRLGPWLSSIHLLEGRSLAASCCVMPNSQAKHRAIPLFGNLKPPSTQKNWRLNGAGFGMSCAIPIGPHLNHAQSSDMAILTCWLHRCLKCFGKESRWCSTSCHPFFLHIGLTVISRGFGWHLGETSKLWCVVQREQSKRDVRSYPLVYATLYMQQIYERMCI